MLFASREVRTEKNCALDLYTDLSLTAWPQSLHKTLGTVFLNMDLPASK